MRVTSIIAGRRSAWAVALLPLILAGLFIGLGATEREPDPADQLPRGADSTAASELADRLPDANTSAAIVLWTADSGKLDEQDLEALRGQVGELLGSQGGEPAGQPGPSGESGQPGGGPGGGGGDPLVPSKDGTAAITVIPIEDGSSDEVGTQVDELRERLDESTPEGVTAQVTGPAGIKTDLGAVFDGADVRLLLATVVIVALLLVVTYRSPILWIIPLVVVGVADRAAVVAATGVLDAAGLPFDGTTTGILSVLVFGAGTDYALLLISRYRDELRRHDSRHEAMALALRRTSEAVLGSAITVFLAVLTLLLSLTPATRGLGVACAVGIVIAASFALIVLPAALVLFGRWVFWPRVPHHGDTAAVETDSIFHKVGQAVSRRPGTVLVSTLVLLGVLATGVLGVKVGLDQADQFLDEPEAITAAKRLAESYPAGTVEPSQVVSTAPEEELLEVVEDTDGVDSARVTASGNGITQVDVVLAGDPGSEGNLATLEDLRERVDDLDGESHVGGAEALAVDEKDAAERDLKLIVPLILIMVLIGLAVLLRSVLGPVLLVLTVVATYVAALGASWWLFTGPLGFDALDSQIPLYAFLFLVALGVDYNIFLVTRAREEAAEHGSREGMLRALTVTGGVITSAGILLAAVFAVLGVLPLVALAQLGTIICVGVLLDTLIVRTMLVPSLGVLLGDRFWWPRSVSGSPVRR